MQDQPAVLVANLTAQSGKAADWIRHARARLDEAQIAHRFVATEPEGKTIDLVTEAIDQGGARVVIYMGGDGTFAEVAKGILASQHAPEVAMGMLPTGTANDQGKSFGLEAGPWALDRNVSVIAEGYTVGCDIANLTVERGTKEIHRDTFFDSFSIGLGAEALATRNRDRERVGRIPGLGMIYRNQLVYIGAVAQRFFETYVVDTKFDCDAVIDGKVYNFPSVLDVIVKNTKIFGGEWIFDPQSESDDGLVELVPVTGRRDFLTKLAGTMRNMPLGLDDLKKLGIEHAPAIPGSNLEITVRTEGGVIPAAQVDGEEIPGGDRYVINVVARALRLVVPREHVDPSQTDRSGRTPAGE